MTSALFLIVPLVEEPLRFLLQGKQGQLHFTPLDITELFQRPVWCRRFMVNVPVALGLFSTVRRKSHTTLKYKAS